mgnify:CR=1 FL=1
MTVCILLAVLLGITVLVLGVIVKSTNRILDRMVEARRIGDESRIRIEEETKIRRWAVLKALQEVCRSNGHVCRGAYWTPVTRIAENGSVSGYVLVCPECGGPVSMKEGITDAGGLH